MIMYKTDFYPQECTQYTQSFNCSSGAELEDGLGPSYTMAAEGGPVDREAPRKIHPIGKYKLKLDDIMK